MSIDEVAGRLQQRFHALHPGRGRKLALRAVVQLVQEYSRLDAWHAMVYASRNMEDFPLQFHRRPSPGGGNLLAVHKRNRLYCRERKLVSNVSLEVMTTALQRSGATQQMPREQIVAPILL